MLNRIILMGRLTRDPELRRTQSGAAVASFTLAVDRDFADKSTGTRATDFIDIVAWRGTAEFVSKYFTKGRMAVVEGRLQIRDWQDRDGNKRRSAEVVADNVRFGESRRDSDGGSYGNRSTGSYGGSHGGGNNSNSYAPAAPQNNSYSAPSAPVVSEFAELSDDDGELPF
ncbi:MAG: single-stranded DNA-binding protein [Clostridiales bacterium]|nr:single-stranded DNA-binding protein [Clostridiales bacterium]